MFCLRIFPAAIVLITAYNAWTDAKAGKPVDWATVLAGLGMIAWAGLIYLAAMAIFKRVESKRSDRS